MAVLEAWTGSGLLVFVIIVIAVVWYISTSRYRQLGNKISGPSGVPILGNLLDAIVHRGDIMAYFKQLRDSYGPLCKGWAGPFLWVGLSEPRDVAVIFNSSKTLSKPRVGKPLNLVFGDALPFAPTEVWKKFRKIMEPTFAHHIIDTYVSTFYEKSRVMTDLLETHCDGQPFDVVDYTMTCLLEMVSETSLGVPMDIQGKDNQHCAVLNFPKLLKIVAYIIESPWLWFTCTVKITRVHHAISELVKPMREFVDALVKQKIDLCRVREINAVRNVSDLGTTTLKQYLGFLEQMISINSSNPGLFTAVELRDQTMMVIGAATDTSAYTIAHTLMLLGLHQDVQMKVLREQEDIFSDDMNRPVTKSDLKKMVYLEQVVNESMRLYPSIPLVARRVDEDVRISDYTLPAGTTVVIPIYLVHREAAYFPDPDKFDPDRFGKENCAGRPACAFIPFAFGRRMCLGKYYAYMAMKTVLSVFLRRYEVLQHGSREDMECFKFEFFLKMVHGYNIKIRSRKLDGE